MNTREFMEKVYDRVSYDEPDVREAERLIGEKIREMTDSHADRFSAEDLSLIRDMLYSIQSDSMREGYISGAKHAAELFSSVSPKVSR